VTYNSGSGATNQVVLSQDASGNVVVTDTVGLTGLTGCLNLTLQTVQCGSGVSEISVLLFDGRDEVTQETTLPTRVQGSADNNVLRSGRAPAESATLFLGGAGFDAVDYSRADRFVTVTADGAANDGRPGDRDNIAGDVEQIIGTSFPDRLTGSGVGNVLDGAFGPDVLSGLGGDDRFPEGSRANGADVLLGGVGSDVADYSSRTADVTITLDAVADDGQAGEGDRVREVETVATGSGDDVLVGAVGGEVFGAGAGDDELTGRGGSDRMSGDAGNDVLRGGAGDDDILARDGERDIVQCGLGGADRATIDAGLDEVRGCEIVG
jgi:Ca2+-binding RTX toxin-like protein